jgi:hypothetical protein
VEQPYITPEQWTEELVSAGFQRPDALALDAAAPYQNSAGIIAAKNSIAIQSSKVTVICHDPESPLVADMRGLLESNGVAVDVRLFGEDLDPHQDVISLLDLEELTADKFSENTFKCFITFFRNHKARILWVLPACQVRCQDPKAAMMLGLARTARSEFSVKLLTVEVDNISPPLFPTEAVVKLLLDGTEPGVVPTNMSLDYEYAIVGGEILVPRFHWQTVSDAAARHREQHKTESISSQSIHIGKAGLLHTMKWSECRIKSAPEGHVLVETKAVGLNFRVSIVALFQWDLSF